MIRRTVRSIRIVLTPKFSPNVGFGSRANERFILFFTYTLVARSFEISVLVISMEMRAALDLWVTQGFYTIFFESDVKKEAS